MLVHYPESAPLRDARRLDFEANHFGEDGGYGDKWVDFKLGKIPFPIPNAPSRVRAVRFHDLHHVLTGYDTDTVGEFEISAWEIAAGCKGFAAAWMLNLSGIFAGTLVSPRRIVRAFVRGRHSRTLYDQPFDPLLDLTVGGRARSLRRTGCRVADDGGGHRRAGGRARRGDGRRRFDDRGRSPVGSRGPCRRVDAQAKARTGGVGGVAPARRW